MFCKQLQSLRHDSFDHLKNTSTHSFALKVWSAFLEIFSILCAHVKFPLSQRDLLAQMEEQRQRKEQDKAARLEEERRLVQEQSFKQKFPQDTLYTTREVSCMDFLDRWFFKLTNTVSTCLSNSRSS